MFTVSAYLYIQEARLTVSVLWRFTVQTHWVSVWRVRFRLHYSL